LHSGFRDEFAAVIVDDRAAECVRGELQGDGRSSDMSADNLGPTIVKGPDYTDFRADNNERSSAPVIPY